MNRKERRQIIEEIARVLGPDASVADLQCAVLADPRVAVGERGTPIPLTTLSAFRYHVWGERFPRLSKPRIIGAHAKLVVKLRQTAELARRVGGIASLKQLIGMLETPFPNGHTEPTPLPEEQKHAD